jgi:glycosyltransferase involved in cell wall biosynthesis
LEINALRILVLAPDANPDSISTALVGYAHSAALAHHHDVTLVVRCGNVEAVKRAGAPFRHVEAIRVPGLDELYAWSIRRIFKYDYGSHLLTAFNYPFTVAFEWVAWRRLKRRIRAGEFDAVLRVLPVTSVLPSAFASFLRNGPVPFVIGPINGGLPWPRGFVQMDNQREWISGLRNVYRFLPYSRSMYRHANAIIAGSSHTYQEFARYRDKLFFVPENGIDDSQVSWAKPESADTCLRLVYVGRLVPYKACDLALRGAAPLLRTKRAHFTVIGDGPDRAALEALTRSLGVENDVSFTGWLPHGETLQKLRMADVLVFPSLREFGGGNVFEALAAGVVPIVVAFGGPGDIVEPAVGYRIPMTTSDDIVSGIQNALDELARDPARRRRMSEEGMRYARERLTWTRKAETVARILAWAARRGPKPELPAPGTRPQVAG